MASPNILKRNIKNFKINGFIVKKSAVIALAVLMLGVYPVFAYQSATSLKGELNSIERQIKQNERKISSYKYSKTISPAQKKRNISRLEKQNYELKRKKERIKRDYRRAIS